MSNFDEAIEVVLNHEGGYVNDPQDPGGSTNFGITQRDLNETYKELSLPQNVKDLTVDDAKKYYKIHWWDKYGYDLINNVFVAIKVFDTAVNIGQSEAIKMLQSSCCLFKLFLVMDGILGDKTINSVNSLNNPIVSNALISAYGTLQQAYYINLVAHNSNLHKFLSGWLRRAKWGIRNN